mgnify:CR=1 FL=1
MEKGFIWVVSFGNNDFDDLNCAFDNFEDAKDAVQTIFDKISAVDPAWQNLELEDEDVECEWAVYTFDYVGDDAKYLENSHIDIVVAPVPYNSLSI